MNKRLLCLWFPDWPIQRLIAGGPELGKDLILLTETAGGRELVRFCCGNAQKLGIRPGMMLSEAQSRLGSKASVFLKPLDRPADRQALEQLAIWCERFSPAVGLEDSEHPQSLLLNVTGVAALFAGEEPLVEQIVRELAEQKFSVRVAIGDTIAAAWAAARFLATDQRPAILPAGQFDPIRALPVEGLRLGPPLISKLYKLGLRSIGQVLQLERSALKARFGKDLLIRIEQLTGEREELITPCRPAPAWEIRRDLEIGTAHFQSIEQLSLALLRELLERLQTRHLGICELCYRLLMEDRTAQELALRLREATADARHLGELLRLKWERLKLNSPVVGIYLKAETVAPLKWQELLLFAEESRQQVRQLLRLLDRLSHRLGPDAVVYAVPGSDPIPERAVEFRPVSNASEFLPSKACQSLLPLDRPLCLLPEPQPIDVMAVVPDGPPSAVFLEGSRKVITQCWGPERIESGWWRGPSIRRDYYRIETQEGGRYWIFRQIPEQTWFLHGKTF